MKIKIVTTITLISIVVAMFSGCSFLDFFSTTNLLRPPRLTGDNTELQNSFERLVGNDCSLYTPLSGNYRSSYILYDINGDNEDEAIVFYAFKSNLSVIHMHLLTKQNGVWTSLSDIIGLGNNIYKIEFLNVNNSTNKEIAVTWVVDDLKKEKTLCIYSVSDFTDSNIMISSIASIQNVEYVFYDFDSDNKDEIFYLYYNSKDTVSSISARLLDYDLQSLSLTPLSDVAINPEIVSVAQVLYNKNGLDYVLLIDGLLPNGKCITEIMLFEKQRSILTKPSNEQINISQNTNRDSSLLCLDFDNDGYYDIPLLLEYPDSYFIGQPSTAKNEVSFISTWQYADGNFGESGKYFLNNNDNYTLAIDDYFTDYYFVYDYSKSLLQARIKAEDEDNLVFSITINDDESGFSFNNKKYNIKVTSIGEENNITKELVSNLITDL